MRILSDQERDEAHQAAIDGGIKGGVVGLTGGLALSGLAQRYSANYRRLTLPLKAMFVTAAVSVCIVIEAEHRMNDYGVQKMQKRPNQTPSLESVLNPEEAAARAEERRLMQERMDKAPIGERAINYINTNRWSVVGGTWLAGMAASGLYLYSKKYMNWQQKLVQARMYAQLITIVALLSTAGLSMMQPTQGMVAANAPKNDSWRKSLEMPEKNSVPVSH